MNPLILATAHGFGEGVEKLGVIAVALLVAVVVLGRPTAASRNGGGRSRCWPCSW